MAGDRQLVALMLTDMAGYTRLSQQDEARALRLLDEHNAAIRDSVQAHGGRAIKGTGDGFLVEFPSALQAVSCAVDIQRRFHDRNARVDEQERFAVRVGLHVGDIVRRDGDIFGDGVNITARIEPLAEAGGICVTGAVRDQVWNKIGRPIVSLGRQQLKNLEAPIEVFRIVLPWDKEDVAPATADRARLAVLPLANVSPDPDDEYFTDGMTEELIYTLSKVPGLKVIAQTSAMSYKGTTKPIREIGRELSVGSVLEGSVRKAGERLRITVQLIDATSEEHLWAARYDRELADVFEIQTEIAQSVAGELRGVLVAGAAEHPTENIDAYKEYLKGRQFWARRTKASLYNALVHFEAAVGADPSFAKAHSGIADTYTVLANHGHEAVAAVLARAKSAAMRAAELDPGLAEAHASLGVLHLELEHDAGAAERELRRALERNPNYATAHHWLGLALGAQGRTREAHESMERALELDPLAHITHVAYGSMLLESGAAEEAKVHFLRARDLEPDYPGASALLALAEMALWNWCGASDALDRALERNPNNTAALAVRAFLSSLLGEREAAESAIRKAERVDPESPFVWLQRGIIERVLGRTEEALSLFQRVHSVRPEDHDAVFMIAACYLQLGRYVEARTWIEAGESHPAVRGEPKARTTLRAFRGILAAREGRTDEVEMHLQQLRGDEESPRRHSATAIVLFAARREDEAFEELEQALAVHDPWLPEAPIEPLLAPFRPDPRFRHMLDVMGLGSSIHAAS